MALTSSSEVNAAKHIEHWKFCTFGWLSRCLFGIFRDTAPVDTTGVAGLAELLDWMADDDRPDARLVLMSLDGINELWQLLRA